MITSMRKPKLILVSVAFFIAAILVIFLASIASNKYLNNRPSSVAKCSGKHPNHVVIIQNDVLSPSRTIASHCDTLTIKNSDDKLREIGFGEHDHHTGYNGIYEKILTKNESLTLVLNTTGTYLFHDHYQDSVKGTFNVGNR